MPTNHWVNRLMRQRPFAYSEVFCHPELPYAAFDAGGKIRKDIAAEIATFCKNESNCTLFFNDGTWFTTWSQGSFEHAPDERIVFATSKDMGKTWSSPSTVATSTPDERIAYGAPFIVPATQRVYVFYFAGNEHGAFKSLKYDSGNIYFVYSDDKGKSWSARHQIKLPERDISLYPERFHGWINHPPQIMPTGEVMFPISMYPQTIFKRPWIWMARPAEGSVVRCDNILTESDPARLQFTLLPKGPRGIRVDVRKHWDNPAVTRLMKVFDGVPYESVWNFQEMTIVPLSDGRWLGVGRTFFGAPGYTISTDRGQTWSAPDPLCYGPGKEPIMHPMTMCPIARMKDGRFVLLFTNNDGAQRGAAHVWDANGKTRNPQWLVVGREIPGETRNGGLEFGKPVLLADVDDSKDTNLKTGVSMPEFIERDGRCFVMYNINKEHILLDEVPAAELRI